MRRTALGLVLSFVLVGCGSATGDRKSTAGARVVSVSRAQVTTEIVGATEKQHDALMEILSGLGPTEISTIEIDRRPPAAWGGAPDAVGFRAKVPGSEVALWHAQLVGFAFLELSNERGLEPVVYVAFGDEEIGGIGPSDNEGQALTSTEAQATAKEIGVQVARSGAKLVRLELLKPRRFAFLLQVQVDEPARFLQDDYEEVVRPIEALGGMRHDGAYIEILDAAGDRVLLQGPGSWVRPDLESCAPIVQFGNAHDREPPPCPVEARPHVIAPVAPPAAGVHTRILGASPKQRDILLEILAGLGPTKIEELEVAQPEPGWNPFAPDAIALIVRGAESLVTDWHSWLLADVFDERARERGLPPVLYVATPGGAEIRLDGPPGEGDVPPSMTAEQAQRLAEEIAERFAAAGAEVKRVSILRPGRFAFDVRLGVDEPAERLQQLAAPLNIVDPPWRRGHAGMHVEIVDTQGRFVWHGAVASGHSGEISAENARPDLEGCTLAPMTRPLGYTEAPCPTERSREP